MKLKIFKKKKFDPYLKTSLKKWDNHETLTVENYTYL